MLLRDPSHAHEPQLLRLAQHQQERRLVLPLDEGHVGAVREVGHRQLEAHRDRRERRGGLETLAARIGHIVEVILDMILHLLVRQRLQHGVQVHHPEIILHELAHGPLEELHSVELCGCGCCRIGWEKKEKCAHIAIMA